MTWWGLAHLTAAVSALSIGAFILAARKGTRKHRVLGSAYLGTMILVNVAALSIFEDSVGPGIFHYLASVSIATITLGYLSVLIARWLQRPPVVHAYLMLWSYAGLTAAGTGQAAAILELNVGASVLATLIVFGIAIHSRNIPVPGRQ